MIIPQKRYVKRMERYRKLEANQAKSVNLISNLRLVAFATGIGAVIALYLTRIYFLSAAAFIIFTFLFIYLIVRHQKVIDNRNHSAILAGINDKSLKRLNGEWKSFNDKGDDFADENHRYTGDLDVFGQGSLYQWICSAVTHTGRQKLKAALSESPAGTREIGLRQEAVAELAGKLWWRQHFMAEGISASKHVSNPDILIKWANEPNRIYGRKWLAAALRILPIVTCVLLVLSIALSYYVPYFLPAVFIGIQILLLRFDRGGRERIFSTAGGYKDDIKAYDGMLRLIETRSFNAAYLNALKDCMLNTEKHKAHEQVKKLVEIVDSFSNRYNMFYAVFNILTLWDYHCVMALEKWKAGSGRFLGNWLDTVGEFESLSSLSIIAHDHPEWKMPEVIDGSQLLKARAMGHPLLPENRVCNDLRLGEPSDVILVTGSNMSGKSTFLRTAGINLVLAYAGAPVCAQSFRCSIMDIYTCMRVSDNLEKNISSFYAELLRIKTIVEAVESGRKVFFLLDEIFRGTNSRDRHTGARVLIRKLGREGAAGMVSTHDLELSSLENESRGEVTNYHFREYYRDGRIHFDYRLHPGVSTSRNAIYLMRMAGIDIDEESTQ